MMPQIAARGPEYIHLTPQPMKLADFIVANREPILAEWEAFARTCSPAAGTMDIQALRDHADQMLTVIAEDLRTPQSRTEQSAKSRGQADPEPALGPTAAEEHGAGRAESGFTIEQMVAEYRALRASVIQLWTRSKGELVPDDIEDLTRFNEAIDQSLAESVVRYNQNLSEAREVFLAILGHDLRTPLGAIYTSAAFMLELGELEEPHRTLLQRTVTSAGRAIRMVGDLLDFTRSRLGGGIPIVQARVDLGRQVRDVVDELRAARPGCVIDADTRKEVLGEWDGARITQALTNVVSNAVDHAVQGSSITVSIVESPDEIALSVHNWGTVISADQMDGIFNPLKTRDGPKKESARGPLGGLGLGLFIAERIVNAHRGRLLVESSEATGTTFTLWLPRHCRGVAATAS
jgi:signal transduction histidine kinase